MLCRRSASLISMTRTSRAIASSILRKFSACASCCDWNSMRSSLETPSTRSATGLPNRFEMSSVGDGGVLDHVVQQRRHQRLRVEVPLREDLGDRERVRDVRLAGLCGTGPGGPRRDLVGLLECATIGGLEVAGDALAEDFEGATALIGGPGSPGEQRRRRWKRIAAGGARVRCSRSAPRSMDAARGQPAAAGPADGATCDQPRRGPRCGRKRSGHRALGHEFWWTRLSSSLPTLPAGDLAQRDDGRLVLVRLDQRRARRARSGARGWWPPA